MRPRTHEAFGKMVSLPPAGWNQIIGWLKQVHAVRQAA